MGFRITIYYDNALTFADPHLWIWYAGSDLPDDFAATGSDGFGSVFEVDTNARISGSSSRMGRAQADAGKVTAWIASSAR